MLANKDRGTDSRPHAMATTSPIRKHDHRWCRNGTCTRKTHRSSVYELVYDFGSRRDHWVQSSVECYACSAFSLDVQVLTAEQRLHLAVTNALSGLVGVGGLFVMGGGWLPGTVPQVLAAASVFLANVSEYLDT